MTGHDAVPAREGLDAEWDRVRLALFVDIAGHAPPDGFEARWNALLVALTDAFDRPAPAWPIYRELRTFAVVHWRDVAAALDAGVATDAGNDRRPLAELLDEIVRMLRRAAEAREHDRTDALQHEMALLRELLGAGGTNDA